MRHSSSSIASFNIPPFLYGTAWKEGNTQRLVELALEQGFRGIDTANQRRHYDEAAVGQAIGAAFARGIITRDDLFLQTKFTFQRGQDHRLPYDPRAPIAEQVEQSFASSLEHLGVACLNSYLLHGPTLRVGLTDQDWAAWKAMEGIHASGRVSQLGVSNFSLSQLEQLCASALIRPSYVQNRCYATQGWDKQVREFCTSRGLVYQGFSLLTANPQVMACPKVVAIARRHGRSAAEILFRFAMDVGMLPLTGTSTAGHMQTDLSVVHFHLDGSEIAILEQAGTA
jgi:diketogulonate reductase-like aldo/keto reductase